VDTFSAFSSRRRATHRAKISNVINSSAYNLPIEFNNSSSISSEVLIPMFENELCKASLSTKS
jgi:hypothetical protein